MKRRPRTTGHNSFSKTLRRLMDEKELSVREAAELAGVSPSTLDDWRAGALPENFSAISRLSKGLGVSFSFLLLGEEESFSRPTPTVTEVFDDGGMLFDGFAKISIQRLIPRNKLRKDDKL